ncbi:MAG: hypothetical protein KKA35_13490 [Proteobacteria bacterium]|nr:hypothetical protein [Pseudomonadota bacterium]
MEVIKKESRDRRKKLYQFISLVGFLWDNIKQTGKQFNIEKTVPLVVLLNGLKSSSD